MKETKSPLEILRQGDKFSLRKIQLRVNGNEVHNNKKTSPKQRLHILIEYITYTYIDQLYSILRVGWQIFAF